MRDLTTVILAGGGGTRLWPMSRAQYPKQFLGLTGSQTLLQQTIDRIPAPTSILVCSDEHRFLVRQQMAETRHPKGQLVLEPVGRNTAPALTCAALVAVAEGGDPNLLVMPADHVIDDVAQFAESVHRAATLADQGTLVVFGVTPTAPEPGFGYIQLGAPHPTQNGAHTVTAFKEKPTRDVAVEYLRTGNYRWNAGIFLVAARRWLELVNRFQPEVLAACTAAVQGGAAEGETLRLARDPFAAGPAGSIDQMIVERLAQEPNAIAAVSLNVGWSDIGSWAGLWDASPKPEAGNVIRGDVQAIDCRDSLFISNHRLVTGVGCESLVVVETADAVLVAPKDRSQDIKLMVDRLGSLGRPEQTTHRKAYRPWGQYEVIDAGDRFQVKRITVAPGGVLSLQMHHHRAEHWIVVKGTAKVTRGEEVFLLAENQSTYIPLGAVHRLENPGAIPLEMIEVQSGSYLGEDDIVRLEDRYSRT